MIAGIVIHDMIFMCGIVKLLFYAMEYKCYFCNRKNISCMYVNTLYVDGKTALSTFILFFQHFS